MSEHGKRRMTAGSMTRTCGGGSSTPFLGGGAVHGITSTQRVPSAAENSRRIAARFVKSRATVSFGFRLTQQRVLGFGGL